MTDKEQPDWQRRFGRPVPSGFELKNMVNYDAGTIVTVYMNDKNLKGVATGRYSVVVAEAPIKGTGLSFTHGFPEASQ